MSNEEEQTAPAPSEETEMPGTHTLSICKVLISISYWLHLGTNKSTCWSIEIVNICHPPVIFFYKV